MSTAVPNVESRRATSPLTVPECRVRSGVMPAYRADPDLEFLRNCTDVELHPLVVYLTRSKDGSPRRNETLTKSQEYQRYAPCHSMYWQLIAAELQTFGANSVTTLFRRGEGVLYREILCEVCDKMSANHQPKAPIEAIECDLLMKVLTDSVANMDEADRRNLIDSLGMTTDGYSGPAVVAALQFGLRAGGFATYQLAVIVANAVARAVLGQGLSFVTNAALTRGLYLAIGPVGWAANGLWLLGGNLAGPAYRVTIPSVIHIALLRATRNIDSHS